MNSLTPLTLPRFHVNALAPTQKQEPASTHSEAQSEATPFAPENNAPDSEPEADASASAEASLAAPILPEIDTGEILSHLEAAIARLEQVALTHSQQLVSGFIQSAFPHLNEAFLADEVIRAVTEMAPTEIQSLTLNVPAMYEPHFLRALQNSPRLQSICVVEPHELQSQIFVEANWADGGLQFDMQRFLESSLAQLTGPMQSDEGQNV